MLTNGKSLYTLNTNNGNVIAHRKSIQGFTSDDYNCMDVTLSILNCGSRKLVLLMAGDELWVFDLNSLELQHAIGGIREAHFGRFG